MVTYDNIIKEINELPVARLEEVYHYVHSINVNTNPDKRQKEYILSFAGLFNDMTDEDISDYDQYVQNTRTRFFDTPGQP